MGQLAYFVALATLKAKIKVQLTGHRIPIYPGLKAELHISTFLACC